MLLAANSSDTLRAPYHAPARLSNASLIQASASLSLAFHLFSLSARPGVHSLLNHYLAICL
jgi:hypothetical protein